MTRLDDGSTRETITAYGKHYNFDGNTAWEGNGGSLKNVSRYDDVRVYKGAAFAGSKYWLTEFGTSCWNNYTPVETRSFMQDALPWLEGQEKIEHYFWFSNRIRGDEWWGNGWQSCSLIEAATDQLTVYGQYYAGQ